MKLSKSDWTLIQGSVLTLSLALIASVLLIYFSEQYTARAMQTWQRAQQQLRAAQSNLTEIQQQRDDIATYLRPYQQAQQAHLIGVEPRLDWLESLAKLQQQNLVSSFSYTIEPQKTITPQPAIETGNFEVHFSDMKLQIELLHEAQLLNFFDALRRQVPGWYQLDGCTLTRSKLGDAGLKAECKGGWLTLQNRSVP